MILRFVRLPLNMFENELRIFMKNAPKVIRNRRVLQHSGFQDFIQLIDFSVNDLEPIEKKAGPNSRKKSKRPKHF